MNQETLNLIMNCVIIVSAIYLIGIGSIMQTHNIKSALFFKFVPILLGILLFFMLFIRFNFIVFGLG